MVTWTQVDSQVYNFTPADTGWNDYDIYSNQGIPKGAVVHIVCANGQDGASADLGVRTDDSSIERHRLTHEAEGGGVTTIEMYVKVDESTGLIETYCDTTTSITFYILGYFEGVDFTELFVDWNASTNWDDRDLSGYGVPGNAVCQFMFANAAP